MLMTTSNASDIRVTKNQEPSSPYSQMMQKIATNSREMTKNGSPVELVSKVILEAVTSKNPNLRYLAGKDVETWAASKKSSETEFYNMMKNFGR
jgi:hypothetical protein